MCAREGVVHDSARVLALRLPSRAAVAARSPAQAQPSTLTVCLSLQLLDELAGRAVGMVDSFTAQGIANTLWGLAQIQYHSPRSPATLLVHVCGHSSMILIN